MITETINQLITGKDLTQSEAAETMDEIMDGEATPSQISGFLVALRIKGETVEEIAGLATTMRQKALSVPIDGNKLIDTCGTGGDNSGSLNISTAAALVAAGAGVSVAKHGNRSMTSSCGSADVLEELGVSVDLGPEGVARSIKESGMGFMFAQTFHPAMRYVAPIRRELGVRTVFNILGPLTNPAGAKAQVLGVADPTLLEKMAQVLKLLGSHHALVIHGNDGLDEFSLSGPTMVAELKNGEVSTYSIDAHDYGLARAPNSALVGGNAQRNAALLLEVLQGVPGPHRDAVIINAGAALLVSGTTTDLQQGINLAADVIDSGKARSSLDELIRITQDARGRSD
jgi:anthranilate phosphoribosyltransferase